MLITDTHAFLTVPPSSLFLSPSLPLSSTMGQMVADKNCEKIHKLGDAMYCCGAGTAVRRREGGREEENMENV